ncbi:hypothetical protein R84865_001535 [Carnimonas sp. R-84865]
MCCTSKGRQLAPPTYNQVATMKRTLHSTLAALLVACLPFGSVSAAPSRIVEGWYAHNATLIMLGAQDAIVGTVAKPSMLPWMFTLLPQLEKAQQFPSPRLNGEAVLALKPDITFVPKSSQIAAPLRRLGLTVKEEGFDSFRGMRESLNNTTEVIDTPLARSRNQAYQQALEEELSKPHAAAASPKVVHIESTAPLRVDGSHTIINEWIRAAGGINAASAVSGNKQPVAIEQLLAWQPDIIIVGGTAGDLRALQQNPLWQRLNAVQAGKVYRNPAGIFPWDRYGPELLLQIKWAKQIVQQGSVDTEQMVAAVTDFYQRFYGISLADNDARLMLEGRPPAQRR